MAIVTPHAEPPPESPSALTLYQSDRKFQRAWDHKGHTLPCRGCEEVLVRSAVVAGWADDSIIGMLREHLSKYGQQFPAESHFIAIISRARSEASRSSMLEKLECLPRPSRDDDEVTVQEKRAMILDGISRLFGLSGEKAITRVVRYTSEPAEYGIETSKEFARIGDIRNLVHQDKFYEHILELTHETIPTFEREKWKMIIVQALMDAHEDVAVGKEATGTGLVRGLLVEYLSAEHVLSSFAEQEEGQQPFRQDGEVYLFLTRFRRWIYVNHGDRIPPKELGIMLRRAGAVPTEPPLNVYRKEGRGRKRTSVRVWHVPQPAYGGDSIKGKENQTDTENENWCM